VAGQVIDRVAAVVDGQVITLSELDFEARVHLIQRGGMTAASGPLDDDTLASALELSIAERVEAAEAERLQAFVIEPEQIQQAMDQFERLFASPGAFQAFLTQHEEDRAAVAAILTRSMRAERLLDSRVQMRSQVAEWEVRQHYDNHPELQHSTFEETRTGLKDQLTRQRYAQLARQELSQMMRAAQIRRVAPLTAGAAKAKEALTASPERPNATSVSAQPASPPLPGPAVGDESGIHDGAPTVRP
jgi:hypothetical protein